MFELVLLPTVLMFGLGLLLWDFTDAETEEEASGELPQELPTTFIRLFESNDTLDAGEGNQTVFALGGDDTITGGAGDDILNLGEGNDSSFFRDINNWIPPDQFLGNDEIFGQGGDDIIIDTVGANELFGGEGADVIIATDFEQSSPDLLNGGAGDDDLTGDFGDTLIGGSGADAFTMVADAIAGEPATILDYEANEQLVIQLSLADQGAQAASQISADGNNVEITVNGDVLLVLAGFTDLNAVNTSVQFV